MADAAAVDTAASSSSSSTPFPVFIDTSLETHLAMVVSPNDTIGELKGKVMMEHASGYPEIGKITVLAMEVKRRASLYRLSDSMRVKDAFDGIKGTRFLYADAYHADVIGDLVAGAAADAIAMKTGNPETPVMLGFNRGICCVAGSIPVTSNIHLADDRQANENVILNEQNQDTVTPVSLEASVPGDSSTAHNAAEISHMSKIQVPAGTEFGQAGMVIETSKGIQVAGRKNDDTLGKSLIGSKKRKESNAVENSMVESDIQGEYEIVNAQADNAEGGKRENVPCEATEECVVILSTMKGNFRKRTMDLTAGNVAESLPTDRKKRKKLKGRRSVNDGAENLLTDVETDGHEPNSEKMPQLGNSEDKHEGAVVSVLVDESGKSDERVEGLSPLPNLSCKAGKKKWPKRSHIPHDEDQTNLEGAGLSDKLLHDRGSSLSKEKLTELSLNGNKNNQRSGKHVIEESSRNIQRSNSEVPGGKSDATISAEELAQDVSTYPEEMDPEVLHTPSHKLKSSRRKKKSTSHGEGQLDKEGRGDMPVTGKEALIGGKQAIEGPSEPTQTENLASLAEIDLMVKIKNFHHRKKVRAGLSSAALNENQNALVAGQNEAGENNKYLIEEKDEDIDKNHEDALNEGKQATEKPPKQLCGVADDHPVEKTNAVRASGVTTQKETLENLAEVDPKVPSNAKSKGSHRSKKKSDPRVGLSDLTSMENENAIVARNLETDKYAKQPFQRSAGDTDKKYEAVVEQETGGNQADEDPEVSIDAKRKSKHQKKKTKNEKSKHEENKLDTICNLGKESFESPCVELNAASINEAAPQNAAFVTVTANATQNLACGGPAEADSLVSGSTNSHSVHHKKKKLPRTQPPNHNEVTESVTLFLREQIIEECPGEPACHHTNPAMQCSGGDVQKDAADPSNAYESIPKDYTATDDKQRSRKKLARNDSSNKQSCNNDPVHSSDQQAIEESSRTHANMPKISSGDFICKEITVPGNQSDLSETTDKKPRRNKKKSGKIESRDMKHTRVETINSAGVQVTEESLGDVLEYLNKDLDASNNHEEPAQSGPAILLNAKDSCADDDTKELASTTISKTSDECPNKKLNAAAVPKKVPNNEFAENENVVDRIMLPRPSLEKVDFMEIFLPTKNQHGLVASGEDITTKEGKPKNSMGVKKSNVHIQDSSQGSVISLGLHDHNRQKKKKKPRVSEPVGYNQSKTDNPSIQENQAGKLLDDTTEKRLGKADAYLQNYEKADTIISNVDSSAAKINATSDTVQTRASIDISTKEVGIAPVASSDSTEDDTPFNTGRYRLAARKVPSRGLRKASKSSYQETLTGTGMIFDHIRDGSFEDEPEDNARAISNGFPDDSSSSESDIDLREAQTTQASQVKVIDYRVSSGRRMEIHGNGILDSQSKEGKLNLGNILRNSSTYKKAKILVSQSQEEDFEDVVPEAHLETP